MNHSTTNRKILVKRHSVSENINREENRSDSRPLVKVNRTNTSFHQTISLLLSSRKNDSIYAKTTTIRPTTILSQRNTTETFPNVYKQIPPPIVPRTTVSRKTKVEQLPTPIERKSVSKNKHNKEFDFIEEQITTLTSLNESEKLVLPHINHPNKIFSDEKISTTQNTSKSTPYTPGLCGLINIGNTCYMNSALQCLSNIPELTQWALDQKKSSSMENKDIIHIYTSLIQLMWSGENTTINPRDIKEIVSRSAPIFIDYTQKDSHEFMNSLLNALERTNSISIIANLFHIHTQSQVTCTTCNFIDITNEITTFLPLSLPQKTLYNKEILLENLINDFCLEDNLNGLYYCHLCKQYTQAKQKTNICLPLPRVLIIQLKPFSFDNTFQKLDIFVRYKFQHKNLLSNNDIYQLCAVSSHIGSLASGHYTTLAINKLMKQWYEFNDHHIKKINADFVVTNNAYILVYLKLEESNTSIS